MSNAKFESLLSDLVGDNVGDGCDCVLCEANRQEMRDAVADLIKAQTGELLKVCGKLQAIWHDPTVSAPEFYEGVVDLMPELDRAIAKAKTQ